MIKAPLFSVVAAVGLYVGTAVLSPPSTQIGSVQWIGSQAHAEVDIKLAGCVAEPERRRLQSLGQRFFNRVADVDKLISPEVDERTGEGPEPDYQRAWPILERLINRCDDCSQYEMAQLYQRAAVIKYNLEDIPQAIDYFKRVAAQAPHIPVSLEAQLNFQIAQLLTSQDQYRESLEYFRRWEALCPSTVPNDYFYFLAQNHYQLDDHDRALQELERGIAYVESKGDLPRESWFRLQLAIYINREDYRAAEPVATNLAVHYTSAQAVKQLAQVYGMNEKESAQMALMDALNLAGALDRESEYRNLAFLFIGAEAPYLGSKVLEAGLNKEIMERNARNLEVYAASLTQARERSKALPIMEEAARLSDTGRLYASLAAIYLDTEQYDKTVEAADRALRGGDLRSIGEVQLYKGTALMYLERYDDAIDALTEAVKDERYERYARDLIRYVRSEKNRVEGLQRASSAG